MRTSASHTQNGNRTVDTQSLQRVGSDGNFVPYQDIEKETVKVNSSTVRTTTRTFVRNADGVKTLFQVTEEEKQTSPDGNSKLVRTTSNTGANGDLQLVQRDIQETKKTGTDALETKTTTYLSGVDGLAPAMKTDELQNRIGAHTLEVQKTTLLPDGTGSWQVGELRKSTVTEEDKSFSSEEQVSRTGSDVKLTEVSRTVRTESETSPGQKREIQDTYSTELGSADWMPRNLYERVEVMFPIKSSALRERVFGEILQNYLKDSEKTRILHQNGSYSRAYQASNFKNGTNGSRFSAQDFFMDLAEGRGTAKPTSRKYRTIAPVLVA